MLAPPLPTPQRRRWLTLLPLLASLALLPGCTTPKITPATENPTAMSQERIAERAVVSAGNTERLQRVLLKAQRGEKVVLGFLGGSITQGAWATTPEHRWVNHVADWWRQTFPQAQFELVNAGIGATGSDIGAFRVQRDLLSHQPDFVMVDFAVNDLDKHACLETMEGVTRRILSAPNQPALLYMFLMNNEGGNLQDWHAMIGRHYGLPMLSFRDAYWPEIQSGRMAWHEIIKDEVHPNDHGHEVCAGLVTHYLNEVRRTLPRKVAAATASLPAPLISDLFARTQILNAEGLKPTRHEHWQVTEPIQYFGRGWQAEQPGDVLEFEVTGEAVGLIYQLVNGPMGRAEAQVDQQPPVKLEGWFEPTWGAVNKYVEVARNLRPGKHMLRITILPEKAAQSAGHRFQVQSILLAMSSR
jgi:lysophospholipase L1-like esterase